MWLLQWTYQQWNWEPQDGSRVTYLIYIIYNLKWTTNDSVSLIKMRVKQHRSFTYQWQVRGESKIYNYISDLDVVNGCCFFVSLGAIFQIALSILSFINFIFSVLYDINRLMTPKMPLLHRRWRCGHKTPLLSGKRNPRRRKSTSHGTRQMLCC